nr:MAG TPA: hypothetical protein [Caudoviricetes sp.]
MTYFPCRTLDKRTTKSTKLGKEITEFQDTDHKLYKKETLVACNHRLFINEFAEGNLDSILNELYDAEEYDTLEIRISSPGGNVLDLQRFQNVIENIFPETTYTVLDNHGFSCGALIFCMGYERIAHEFSQIMFHDWSGWYYGKAADIDKRYEFDRKIFKDWTIKLLKDFLTKNEIEDMFEGKEYWFDTIEMCKRNICTHVMYKGSKLTAAEFLELKNPKEPKAQKESNTKKDKPTDTKSKKPKIQIKK